MRPLKAKIFLFFLACALYLAFIQWSESFADPDSFYHAKMAVVTAREGFVRTFPWLKFSSFSGNFTDQHLLYHILLVPFASAFGPLLGTKILAVLLAAAVFAVFYAFLARRGVRYPLFYALALLSVPPFVFRISLAKAGPLAVIFLIAGLSAAWSKKYPALFLIAFLYAWTHGGWMLLLILTGCHFVSAAASGSARENVVRWLKTFAAAAGGAAAGIIVNPYFPHNLRFWREQFVSIGLVNYQGMLDVGGEWRGLRIFDSAAANYIFLTLLFASWASLLLKFAAAARKERGEGGAQKILALALFTGLLAAMTLKSQRYLEYFVPFFIITGAFIAGRALEGNSFLNQALEKFQSGGFAKKAALAAAAVWTVIFAGSSFILRERLTGGERWTYLEDASRWLARNTPAGATVFHGDWSDFPLLFFHNDKNFYISGMDPTFFHLYDAKLCSEWARIAQGGEPDAAEKIRRDFGAGFVLIKPSEKNFLEEAEKDEAFRLRYRDAEAKIFEVR